MKSAFIVIFCFVLVFTASLYYWQQTAPARIQPTPVPVQTVIPTIQPTAQPTATVSAVTIYFANSQQNNNTTDCSVVTGVVRTIPRTSAVAQAALKELFKGPTSSEKAQGYTSLFSSATSDILLSITIQEGTAYVNLRDIRTLIPNASASCGSAQFFAEVESTLGEFEGIQNVIYAINGDPEPFYEWMQIGCTEENNNCDATPFL